VDFIKIYGNIPREGFFGLAEEAGKLGLPVVGHEPLAQRDRRIQCRNEKLRACPRFPLQLFSGRR
jgi:hypothetical protein